MSNGALTYLLRMKKTADNFALSYSPDGVTPRIGVVGRHYSANAVDPTALGFEYFEFTPVQGNGVFESRVLDLGASGLTSTLTVQGSSLAGVSLQFRAADTPAALSSLPYVGPDGTAGSSHPATYHGTLDPIAGKRYVQYRAAFNVEGQINDLLLNATVPLPPSLTAEDARDALRTAGGLQAATSADLTKLDIARGISAGRTDIRDAAQILQEATDP